MKINFFDNLSARARRLLSSQALYQWVKNRGKSESDVYLVSFPKCGRTWLRLILGKALSLHYGFSVDDIGELFELEDVSTMNPDLPKIIVTHDDRPFWKTPDELERSKENYRDAKVIFLVRDPRDVVVSSYFERSKRVHLHNKDRNQYEGTLSEFLKESIGSLDTLLAFYNIWAMNREVPKGFLLIRYENLHTNPVEEIRKIFDFLPLPEISEETIRKAVEFSQFDKMRKLEAEQKTDGYRLSPGDAQDQESFKTRRGVVKGYEDYLKQEEIQGVNQRIKRQLSEFYHFYV